MQEYVVDLHVHSHFSRATSKNCDLEGLYRWGKLKGINIIGTGDFTHPEWFAEIQSKLVPAEPGLMQLRPDLAAEINHSLPLTVRGNIIRFIPSVEIATIYKKGDLVRKLHQLVIMPDFKAVSELNARLEKIGNLKADGRPILGLDSKELLRHALQSSPDALYIPAHIWTPWFGMFGSKSGFDSIEEAFDELAPEIKAIETGLSSDPSMNWRVANLDGRAITSHSDAHSPQKLGREATVVKSSLSYDDIIGAIKQNDERLVGTIEFFPEEGKYHMDGHRDCNIRFTPQQTKAHQGLCPECSKPLVIGVHNRLESLASRSEDYQPVKLKQTEYIIPLAEILAELNGTKSSAGKVVTGQFHDIIGRLGDEFNLLRNVHPDEVHTAGYPLLAHAISKLRAGDVVRDPGYDGIFGTIKVFKDPSERAAVTNQLSLL